MGLKSIILSAFHTKFSPLITKLKKWMNPNHLKNQIRVKLPEIIKKLFEVNPRNEKDYYTLFWFMVSKKLAYAITIVTILLCACYLVAVLPKENTEGNGNTVKTYRYNALPLKYVSGKARILGKSGYQAYVGDVDKGGVTGEGTLYHKNGDVVYTGAFDQNQFNGEGELYYGNNLLKYQGTFKDNKYHGEGILYRLEGTKEYVGSFWQDQKEGSGQLYDYSENLVYTGSFRKDQIVYQELLGKTTAEVADMYTGQRMIYDNDKAFCVSMPDIQAVYVSETGEDKLEEEWAVKGIYVLQDTIMIAGEQLSDIGLIKEHLGQPIYEGNAVISLSDAVAIEEVSNKRTVLQGKVLMKTTQILKDVIQVDSYDNGYLAYLYIFKKDGYTYTFFCDKKDADFAFYLIGEE